MRRSLFLTLCLLVFCVLVAAQEEAEYEELMETTNQMMGSLALNIQGKDGTAAREDSKTLDRLFAQIYAFFEKKNVTDAMQFAKNAAVGFREAGDLASAGKFQEALAKFHATRSNCDGCHEAHRERAADGSWKIKY